ncbi:MAG: alcohol dehydrogenase catalytic domain-containing protein [Candidatus Vogelbacteria bacterium]|nr:alcohol dehydrogenase catalytic domain-containing protein [Candidatus Vogelbacteria bacterium]
MVETSIIIRTFNEERHLAKLLDSLEKQSYRDYEIILVDSGSTDNTLTIAGKYPVEIVSIQPADFSFGYSLNTGCRIARGKYLVFVSAHTYPLNNNWLSNLIKPFQDSKIAMVYGRQIGNEVTCIAEARDFKNNFGDKSKILVEESFGNNANAAIRRYLWESIHFDENLPGLEDIDWAHKVQKQALYIFYKADAVIVHIHDESFKHIYNRFKRESLAYQTIFPNHEHNFKKMFFSFCLIGLKDLFHGLSQKKSIITIIKSIVYRIAEFRAYRDGFRLAAELNNKLKNELVLPEKNLSVVIAVANDHRLSELPIPDLRAGEVLIKVKYVGVCSTDLDILSGDLDYYRSGWAKYPIVPGHEFSGIIAKLGCGVGGLSLGDKVVGECILGCGKCRACASNNPIACQERKEVGVLNFNGAYAKYLSLPRRFVHKLPAQAKLNEACLIEPLAVVLRGTKKLLAGENNQRKKVAVLGCGTIGNLCAQYMTLNGHAVTVFDRNASKLNQMLDLHIQNFTTISGLDWFDYLIEATGKIEVLQPVLSESKTGARILLLGLPYAIMKFNFENVVCFDKTVIGSVGSSRKEFLEAIRIYPQLDLSVLTKDVFPFEAYHEAWDKHEKGQVAKAIIEV